VAIPPVVLYLGVHGTRKTKGVDVKGREGGM